MTYAFARIGSGEVLIVAVNTGTSPEKLSLEGIGSQLSRHPAELLYGLGEAHWAGETLTLELPGRSGVVLG
jgi:hypothetical protein